MAKSNLEKYIKRNPEYTGAQKYLHTNEIPYPSLILESYEDFGNKTFTLFWTAIAKPFVDKTEPEVHDFDEFLLFAGGDLTNMLDLGGEVEFSLGEDAKSMEKFVFDTATWVYVPKGLYHCPLNFKKVNDPLKPILFHTFYFAAKYGKKS